MAYQIPRNVKGEGRILFIFSTKALIYTAIGAGIGLVIAWLLGKTGMGAIRYIAVAIPALIGFTIGTFKIPNISAFEVTRKTAGENIDDVILRWLKFKIKNKKKIYIYSKGGTKDDR